ncbi:MAG TPA: hypothetical protein VMT21_01500 [Gemmatimonadales bacterium]|nr:hypothetical protein [Gemmatimonadales bacterium]
MRHHRLPLLAGVVALGLALAVASCEVSTNVGSYDVTYRANLLGIATIDSVLYSPGTGKCTTTCNADSSLIKVTTPALNAQGIYSQELFLPSGATVQATLYGSGTAAGTAQFAVIWMTASGTIRGDSLTAPTAAATKFTITIPKMKL